MQALLLVTLASAACAVAAPSDRSKNMPSIPRAFVGEASRPARFPATTVLNGRTYVRLTEIALKRAIVGKSIDPATLCRGCTASGQLFKSDGTYIEEGDRWTGQGHYVIAGEMILISLEGRSIRYAFYGDGDGKLLLSFEAEGAIHFLEVIAS